MQTPFTKLFILFLIGISLPLASCSELNLQVASSALSSHQYSTALQQFQLASESKDPKIRRQALAGLCRTHYEMSDRGPQRTALEGYIPKFSGDVVRHCSEAEQAGAHIPVEIANGLCSDEFGRAISAANHVPGVDDPNPYPQILRKSVWCKLSNPSLLARNYAKLRASVAAAVLRCHAATGAAAETCPFDEVRLIKEYTELPGANPQQLGLDGLDLARADEVKRALFRAVDACYNPKADTGLSYPAQVLVNRQRITALTIGTNTMCVMCGLVRSGLTVAEIAAVPHCLGYDSPLAGWAVPDAISPTLANVGTCIVITAALTRDKSRPPASPAACQRFERRVAITPTGWALVMPVTQMSRTMYFAVFTRTHSECGHLVVALGREATVDIKLDCANEPMANSAVACLDLIHTFQHADCLSKVRFDKGFTLTGTSRSAAILSGYGVLTNYDVRAAWKKGRR